jgi:hypothetical protein
LVGGSAVSFFCAFAADGLLCGCFAERGFSAFAFTGVFTVVLAGRGMLRSRPGAVALLPRTGVAAERTGAAFSFLFAFVFAVGFRAVVGIARTTFSAVLLCPGAAALRPPPPLAVRVGVVGAGFGLGVERGRVAATTTGVTRAGAAGLVSGAAFT